VNRSTNIKSRVFRNLKKYGLMNSDVQDPEIYDEIQQGQDRIISDAFPDKILTIALVDGQDTYLLTTDNISVITSDNRENIASVKIIKVPSDWTATIDDYGNKTLFGSCFEVIPNKDFVEYVNAGVSSTGQPRAATIIDGQLKVYPVPTSDYDGDEIELYTYLSSSAGTIDANTIPEIPKHWDKALEYFATAQFLIGDDRGHWDKMALDEITRLRPITNRKMHNLQRNKISGW
jgi:hypothetical protein